MWDSIGLSALVVLLISRDVTAAFTNTTGDHVNEASTISANIGDYVAAGLGISVRGSSANIAATADIQVSQAGSSSATRSGDGLTHISDSVTRSQTHFNTNPTARASMIVSSYGNVTTEPTKTTSSADCWHSWLDYWSASSFNQATHTTSSNYESTLETTELVTEHTLLPTSSWMSHVYTETLYTSKYFYSEGFPVSYSVSYWTTTNSLVGWYSETLWSSLGLHSTTFTTILSGYDEIEITQSPTALPTPQCQLPAVVPECSSQWSAYFHDDIDRRYFGDGASGYFENTPDCKQAMITGDLCTSMADIYFGPDSIFGHTKDVGWVTANQTSYFPASKSLAPGCKLGCQTCSITGESVQLYYWPTQTASHAGNVTATAMLTGPASLRTMSIDGTVLTSPTVYISYDILHAGDSCGAVGKTYRNTIVPLSNTDHLFSLDLVVGGRGFELGSLTRTFNFTDLVEPVPNSIYNRQSRCKVASVIWDVSGQQGNFSCARIGPYAPIIAVPPEGRALDPAWSSCQAWYGGLFDPPKALQPADAIALPTMPSTFTAPAATPQSSVDSGLPVETSALKTTSARPQVTESRHTENTSHGTHKSNVQGPSDDSTMDTKSVVDPTSSTNNLQKHTTTATGPDANTGAEHSNGVSLIASMLFSQSTRASDSNVPQALSTSGLANGTPHSTESVPDPGADTPADSSKGAAAIASIFLSQGAQASSVSVEPAASTMADQDGPSAQTAHAGGDLQASKAAIEGQTTSGSSDDSIGNGDPGFTMGTATTNHANEVSSSAESSIRPHDIASVTDAQTTSVGDATVLFTLDNSDPTTITGAKLVIAAETLTAIQDGTHVFIAGTRLTVGQVTTIANTHISVANSVVVVGSSTASFHNIVDPAVEPGSKTTVDDIVHSNSGMVYQAHKTLSPDLTLSKYGSAVTIHGQVITNGPSGISIVSPTRSIATVSATGLADPMIVIDSTTYKARSITGNANAVVLQAQTPDPTLSQGGPAATIHGQVVTNGPSGLSMMDPAGTILLTSASGLADPVIVIDGATYQASPISGDLSAIVLQAQPSSSLDSDVTAAADHSHPKGSKLDAAADPTAKASDSTSESAPLTSVRGSESSQQATAAPTEESSARGQKHGSWDFPMVLAVLLVLMFLNI